VGTSNLQQLINYHREIVFLSQIQSQNKIPFNGVSAVAKTLLLLACLLMVFVRNVPVMSAVAKTHAVANLSFMFLLPMLLMLILPLSLFSCL
jgi:Mg2+/Co2+ transporter CorB